MILSVTYIGDGRYEVVMKDGTVLRCDRDAVAELNTK